MTDVVSRDEGKNTDRLTPGLFWLFPTLFGALVVFSDSLEALPGAWSSPESSHMPLIPVLFGFLFLKQFQNFPADTDPQRQRWVALTFVVAALALATLGKWSSIADLVAHAVTTWLRLASSEFGTWFLWLVSAPVFINGNIVDPGAAGLKDAEASTALRYLLPILSFSYILAVLHQGSVWRKAMTLLAALHADQGRGNVHRSDADL